MPAELADHAQRAGRSRWTRSFPEHAEPDLVRLDVLRVAALATPDDEGPLSPDLAGLA